MCRIETHLRQESALSVSEMIMLRLALRVHRDKAIIDSYTIILVLRQSLPEDLHNLISTLGIARVRRPQSRPFHVRSKMPLMGCHRCDGTAAVLMLHVFKLCRTSNIYHGEQAPQGDR